MSNENRLLIGGTIGKSPRGSVQVSCTVNREGRGVSQNFTAAFLKGGGGVFFIFYDVLFHKQCTGCLVSIFRVIPERHLKRAFFTNWKHFSDGND